MPKATTSGSETQHFDLKTLPDGYVVIRRMTYGEFLRRRQMTSNMKFEAQKGEKDFQGTMELLNKAAIEYEFGNCIVEHNLEDDDGKLLNFKKVADIEKLDPRIGDEINERINEMNQFEEDEEGNSGAA